jgi:hypothetical protein
MREKPDWPRQSQISFNQFLKNTLMFNRCKILYTCNFRNEEGSRNTNDEHQATLSSELDSHYLLGKGKIIPSRSTLNIGDPKICEQRGREIQRKEMAIHASLKKSENLCGISIRLGSGEKPGTK